MTMIAAAVAGKLPWFKIAGAVGGLLFVAYVAGLQLDRNHLAALNNTHKDCVAAVQGARGSKPLTVCDAPILAAAEARLAAQACDAALSAKPENEFGIRTACTTPVKTLMAERDAAGDSLADAQGQLKSTKADQAGAISRAVGRATAQAKENASAQAVIAAQPHGDDGLVECGADCLRQLGQGSAPAAGQP